MALTILSPNAILALAISAVVYNIIIKPVYNVWFHPLRRYPGPKLWAASYLPWGFAFQSGSFHEKIQQLHEQYGHVVRIAPDELSFDEPEAWEDIYGRGTTKMENHKAPWYLNPKREMMSGANEEDHKRMRKVLFGSFNGGAIQQQEALVKTHVDVLIEKLLDLAKTSEKDVDLFQWFSYCTFDLIGDQTMGQTFGCLNESRVGKLLSMVFGNVKFLNNLLLCSRIPFFFVFLDWSETYRMWKGSKEFGKILKGLMQKRLSQEPKREDWLEVMQNGRGNASMTPNEILQNAEYLTLSATEAMSTMMALVVHMIETHPEVKTKVMDELKSVFQCEEEITMQRTTDLTYLTAVIEESMRYQPPGPNSFWRETPPEGNEVRGEWIPGKTVIGIPHRAVYRSEQYFARANEFLPERFLKDTTGTEFENDRKDGYQPFSYGSRQCLAMHLANAEIRYILARVMWNFDVQMTPQSQNWTEGKQAWLIWEKNPMYVKLAETTSR